MDEQRALAAAQYEYDFSSLGGAPNSMERSGVTFSSAAHSVSCSECMGTAGIDQKLLVNYKVAVCGSCRHAQEEKYKLITKTNGKEKYLLTDHQLSKLPHMSVSNPRKMGWNDMKLYLSLQLQQRCYARWGNAEGLERERARRKAEAEKRRRKKARKRAAEDGIESGNLVLDSSIQGLREGAGLVGESSSDPTTEAAARAARKKKKLDRRMARLKRSIGANRYHRHEFGAEVRAAPSIENGVRVTQITQKCKTCGFELRIEEVGDARRKE